MFRYVSLVALLLLCVSILASRGAASETGRSGDENTEAQSNSGQARPATEVAVPEQTGARYQLSVVHKVVEVACYVAGRRTARVHVEVEHSGVPRLVDGRVRWVQPWSGAEWSLGASKSGLALTAISGEQGSPPSDIVLRFEGVQSLSLDSAGNLLIITEAGDLHQRRPATVSTSSAPVTAKYVLLGGNRVAVEVWKEHAFSPAIQHSVASLFLP